MDFSDSSKFNAVRVRIQRSAEVNGQTPLFFARALGISSAADQREATAAFRNSFGGFELPSDGSNLGMMPFAMDEDTWNELLAGGGSYDDGFSWDRNSETVSSGGDGVREVNLYPQQNTILPPGNRGTVDIGSNNNSTSDIARQVLYGANAADLAFHGGSLELNDCGELMLNGDTGISAGIKDELASIIGQPRIIPSVQNGGRKRQQRSVYDRRLRWDDRPGSRLDRKPKRQASYDPAGQGRNRRRNHGRRRREQDLRNLL